MGSKQSNTAGSNGLSREQIAVLKANTNYSEKEIREWHMGFRGDCPSGKLDKNQFIRTYRKFYPIGKVEKYCNYAFNAFDTNKDGTVDFNEFILALSVTNHGSIDERLSAAFDVCDISNDGLIDQNELTELISSMYDLFRDTDRQGDRDPRRRAQIILCQLDTNGDRKISKQEFISGCKNDPVVCKLLAPQV